MSKEELGFDAPPARYMTQGRETVDRMRDEAHRRAELLVGILPGLSGCMHVGDLADELFAFACASHVMKYEDREGAKAGVDPERDRAAARFWREMMLHVRVPSQYPDPRSSRPGFTRYVYHPLDPAQVQTATRASAPPRSESVPVPKDLIRRALTALDRLRSRRSPGGRCAECGAGCAESCYGDCSSADARALIAELRRALRSGG